MDLISYYHLHLHSAGLVSHLGVLYSLGKKAWGRMVSSVENIMVRHKNVNCLQLHKILQQKNNSFPFQC